MRGGSNGDRCNASATTLKSGEELCKDLGRPDQPLDTEVVQNCT